MIGANGIAVLAAAPERVRSRDTLFVYRPDSDFYYLTGFAEPEAVAVLVPGRPQGEFLLFCRERNPERELWDGPRAGPEGAVAHLRRRRRVPDLATSTTSCRACSSAATASTTRWARTEFDQRLLAFIQTLNSKRQSSHAPSEIVALDHLLHEMRLFKSRAEPGIDAPAPRRSPSRRTRARCAPPARHDGIRARGRVPARVPPPRRGLLVSADRRRRRERLRAALPRERRGSSSTAISC